MLGAAVHVAICGEQTKRRAPGDEAETGGRSLEHAVVPVHDLDAIATCRRLAETGMLVPASNDESRWRLTTAGLSKIVCCMPLGRPVPAVRRRDGAPLEEMTLWELHQQLAIEGWTWQPRTRGGER